MEKFIFVMICMAVFILSAVLTGNTDTYKLGLQAKSIITECESKLSRELNCKIIAVSKEDDNHE